jgi:hypothetical protein
VSHRFGGRRARATELIDTASLTDAEAITEHITGISELRYETLNCW